MRDSLIAKSRLGSILVAFLALTMATVGFASPARADTVVDVNFQKLVFLKANIDTAKSTCAGLPATCGMADGDKVLWTNLITTDGVTVDALVTTNLERATVQTYGTGNAGVAGDFQVDLGITTADGFAAFTFQYFKSGTYDKTTDTGEVLELQNVQATGKDIDLSQYNSFVGASGYTVASNTFINPIIKTPSGSTWPADLKFQGRTGFGVNNVRDQATVSFAAVSSTTVLMGNAIAGADQYFALTWQFQSFSPSGMTSQGASTTISYDINGGTGTPPGSVSGVYGQVNGTVATGTGFNRPDYTFLGTWNTAPDGSGATYTAGNPLIMPSNGTVLYAMWGGNYSVSYVANGATEGTVPDTCSFTNVVTPTTCTIAGQGSLVRPGYAFMGWNTAANGSGTAYAAGDTYGLPSNLVLYAQWQAATLTVTVKSRGPQVGGGNVEELYNGVKVELSNDNGVTWTYKPSQTTTATGFVDFGAVDPNTTYKVRLTAPCDDQPVEIKDAVVTTGDYPMSYTLAATVPCQPVLSYNLALDTLQWTIPLDGGSRIRYYTYQYNTPARLASSQPWAIYARYWPATEGIEGEISVPFVTYGDPVKACPAKAAAPYAPAPYDFDPNCMRMLGTPAKGTTFAWRVGARNALDESGAFTPAPFNTVGWGIPSNTIETNRQ